jgi:hypothetical protein
MNLEMNTVMTVSTLCGRVFHLTEDLMIEAEWNEGGKDAATRSSIAEIFYGDASYTWGHRHIETLYLLVYANGPAKINASVHWFAHGPAKLAIGCMAFDAENVDILEQWAMEGRKGITQ